MKNNTAYQHQHKHTVGMKKPKQSKPNITLTIQATILPHAFEHGH